MAAIGLAILAPVAVAAPGDVHTSQSRDIAAGPASSDPERLTVVGSTLFFTADHPTYGRELWKTTAGGVTSLVRNIAAGAAASDPLELTAVGSTLFFTAMDSAGDRELWKSDGTGAGTVRVRNIRTVAPPNGSSAPGELTEVNGTLFFAASDNAGDRELWKSNGVGSGTVRVRNIYPTGSANVRELTSFAGALFFVATQQDGSRIWRSDGLAAGTVRVSSVSMIPQALTVVGSKLFFTGETGTYNREPWVSDGSSAGTKMLRNLDPEPGVPSNPSQLTDVGGTLFFSADVGGDRELYKSDGTAAGTRIVRNVNLTQDTLPLGLTAYNGKLYFSGRNNFDAELYVSDGTFAGTKLVKDIYNQGASSPTGLTVAGGFLFFRALTFFDPTFPGTVYDQLIRSDGTTAGTIPVGAMGVADDEVPAGFVDFQGTLYYRDSSAGFGVELWQATIEN
ncbi:hypothetical protein [Nocardioides humilatus]|uniref:hypothetical protein n=1 Tax=Nocardioides humilatus TaxID=2607660 RepID=UPI00165F4328|nr:hypothetical protein [Nocardioides humilatus]